MGPWKTRDVSKYAYFQRYQKIWYDIERSRLNLSYVVNGPLFLGAQFGGNKRRERGEREEEEEGGGRREARRAKGKGGGSRRTKPTDQQQQRNSSREQRLQWYHSPV